MQRGVTGADGIGISAFVEEERRNVPMPAVGGKHQRAGAIGQSVVGICAGGEQYPGRPNVPDTRGEQQRGAATSQNCVIQLLATRSLSLHPDDGLRISAGAGAHVSAGFDQQLDNIRLALCHGPHERGLIVRGLLGLDVGPARQQRLDGPRVTRARTGHEYRFAVQQLRVGIGARRQETLDHRRAAVRTRLVQPWRGRAPS